MYFSVLHRIPRKTLSSFHVSSLRELVKDSGGLSFLWQLSGKRNNNVLPGKNCFLIDLAFGRKDQITKLQLWKTLVIFFLKILARLCSQHYIKQTQVYCNFLCSCVVVLDSWIVCIPIPSILHYRKIAVRNLRIYAFTCNIKAKFNL